MNPLEQLREFYANLEVDEGYNKLIEETSTGFTVTFSKQGMEDEFKRMDIIDHVKEKDAEGNDIDVVYFNTREQLLVQTHETKVPYITNASKTRHVKLDEDLDLDAYWRVVKNVIDGAHSNFVLALQGKIDFEDYNLLQRVRRALSLPMEMFLSTYEMPFKKVVVLINKERANIFITTKGGQVNSCTIVPKPEMIFVEMIVTWLSDAFEQAVGKVDYKKLYALGTYRKEYEEIINDEVYLKSYKGVGAGFSRTVEQVEDNTHIVFKQVKGETNQTVSHIHAFNMTESLFSKLSAMYTADKTVMNTLARTYIDTGMKLLGVHQLDAFMTEMGLEEKCAIHEFDEEYFLVLDNGLFISLSSALGTDESYGLSVFKTISDVRKPIIQTYITKSEKACEEVHAFIDKLEAWLDYEKLDSFKFLDEPANAYKGLYFAPRNDLRSTMRIYLDFYNAFGKVEVKFAIDNFELTVSEDRDMDKPLHTFLEQYDNPERFFEKQREIALIARQQGVNTDDIYDPADLSDNEA